MNVAMYVALRLRALGVTHAFSVVGGGAMFLNDAFGRTFADDVRYLHHEQAAAIAAEAFARVHATPAALVVTTGPGAINALNGVFGAYTDSIPMIVVGGQVKRETISGRPGLAGVRQLGDQEARTTDVVATLTKFVVQVQSVDEVPAAVDAACRSAVGGRPGPAWIEIPIDVQGADIDQDPLAHLPDEPPAPPSDPALCQAILADLAHARRPLILAGTGVRLAGAQAALVALAELADVPVATAWTHDLIPGDHRLYAGRPGTIGTRAGNLLVQGCDHLLVLGSRLNIRQVSYNWAAFAQTATITWVDVDESELHKPFVTPDRAVVADLRWLLPALVAALGDGRGQSAKHAEWVGACAEIRARYEPRPEDYPERPTGINPYRFVMCLFQGLADDAIVACGNASACIIPFQVGVLRGTQRLFSNSGSASMGYDLPAALGAAAAAPDRPVICIAGDGSLMMNLQELQTLTASGANLVLIVLENRGYLSIKQTQTNFFGREHGASPDSGITFPDFAAVGRAFGLPVFDLSVDQDWRGELTRALSGSGPRMVVAHLDPEQEFEPRLKSRMLEGRIVTPELDDMYPHLPDVELALARGLARGAAEPRVDPNGPQE